MVSLIGVIIQAGRPARAWSRMTKPQCAILIQMRAMEIGPRHFLFNIKAAETDRCGCDKGSQTPKHILMQCPRYIIPRINLREQLWEVGKETDYDEIISKPQAIRSVANFMHRVGLLQKFQQVDIEDDEEEPIGPAA